MEDPSFKEAITICKLIMRNGYDAYIVNTQLQHDLINVTGDNKIDLATNSCLEDLLKFFPKFIENTDANANVIGTLDENGIVYRFYRVGGGKDYSGEECLLQSTPTILEHLAKAKNIISNRPAKADSKFKTDPEFFELTDDSIKILYFPDEVLKNNYILAIRILRHAANFGLNIEKNTWAAVVRASLTINQYVTTAQLMAEWREVAAENMWKFVQLMFDSQILHSYIPELCALFQVMQTKNSTGIEERVFEHTINSMSYYPEEEFAYDWYGVFALLFHDIGKLYTGEYYDNKWTFYQHHKVGAKLTRNILKRLHMSFEEIDLISSLVENHMRFQFMMTDKGIRAFSQLKEQKRLIQMSKANTKAHENNFTAFNHNLKYMSRADMPREMIEPFLDGNEIMEVAGLQPGKHIGEIRQKLLAEQVLGNIVTREQAVEYVKELAKL